MDVSDQYIWSKNNCKQKMDEFRVYFNNFICCVFGVNTTIPVGMRMFEISWTDLDIKYVQN